MYKQHRLLSRILSFAIVLSMLFTGIVPGFTVLEANAVEIETGVHVLYVDGVGSGNKDGSSAANAFKTVAEAYNAIPDGATKTTIVICGTVNMRTGTNEVGSGGGGSAESGWNHWCLPENSGEVIITSVYGDEDYRTLSTPAGLNIPMHWYMLSDTTFENIRITGRAYTIYANYNSLHLGEGVDASANSDKLFAKTVYLGTYSQINGSADGTNKYPITDGDTVKDIEFTMESGIIETLYGGGKYSQSYLGTATLGKDNNVTLNIKGGTVGTLYGSGQSNANKQGGHHSSIQVNVSGGEIGMLYGAAGNATVYNGVAVTVSGGTVNTLAAAATGASITGSKTVEYKAVTGTMPTATGFDTLKLTNATVTVPSLDSVAAIQATDDSKLTVSETAPAAAVSVTLTKAGEVWNAGTLITAPAGTAENMFVLTNTLEEGYSWEYASADSNTTWSLSNGEDEGGEGTDDPIPTPTGDVFYVNGVGSGTKDGSSAANAFKTIADAYNAIPDDATKTTIVICGNVKAYEGALALNTKSFRFTAHAGKVIITSVYGTEDYKETAKIDFESMNYYFLGDTTFEKISIGNLTEDNTKTGKAGGIYANYYPFRLGEGVSVEEWFANTIYLGTSSTINGTGGNKTSVAVADTSFTMDSGATGNVYGGGDYWQGATAKGKDNKVTITINGGSPWTIYGSGLGGTDNAHHKSVEITVNGGSVNTLYGAHGTATVYDDVSININGGTVKNLYGARKYAESGGNASYTPHIAGDVMVTVKGGTITNLYAKEDGAQVNGDIVLHYQDTQNVALAAVQGFDTLKMTSASVTVPAGMEALWSSITQLQMTDDSLLTLASVPTVPAQKVGVVFTKSGADWNTATPVITAPSGTADIFSVVSPLDHSFVYNTGDNVTWTLKESEISIGQAGTKGEELNVDLGLPKNDKGESAYTPLNENATAYETFLQKLEDLGEAKDGVNVIQPVAVKGEVELYVDGINGNDDNLGNMSAPLKTISKALTYVEALQEMDVDGVVVYLRAGTYVVTDPITLNEKHSGKNGVPVIISAFDDEEVVITSSVEIAGSAFAAVADETVKGRLQDAVEDKIVAVDLTAQGVTDLGSIIGGDTGGPNYQIYVNGSEFVPARYPNATTLWVGEVLDKGPIIGGTEAGTNLNSTGVEFKMQDFRPTLWQNDGNIWLKGSMYAEWDIKNIRVAEIREESIKLDGGAEYGARSLESNRYYYYNILEELDAPGEYYLDLKTGILYLYPVANMNEATVTYSGNADDLILLKDTENVILNGLTIKNGAGYGVHMDGCQQTVVQNCKITKVGTGVLLNECKNSGVIYSDLDEIANRPVEILPAQRYLDYTPDHNFVQNCYIHSTGVKNPKFCAIYVRGTGNVVSHNLLQGGFSVSIYLQYAKECIVEYNEIVGSPTGTYDGGAIYIPYGISDTGHHIRYNYIHDIAAFSDRHNPCGIYFDEGLSGNYAYGNIMSNVPCGFFTNSGSENVIVNNVILDGRAGTVHGIRGESNHDAYSITTKLGGRGVTNHRVYEQYLTLTEERQQEIRDRYPLLVALFDKLTTAYASETGTATTGLFVSHDNYIANNVIYDCKDIGFAGTGHVIKDNIILNGENPFVNVAEHNFALKSSVDTSGWGFVYQIPSMDQIGVLTANKQKIGSFEVFIPAAGEEKVNPMELLLRWTIAGGADNYVLKIAKDAAMTEVIHTETLEATQRWFVNETELFNFGATYYWQVTAYSTAESRIVIPVSTEVSAFTTITYEEYLENNQVDMTKLNASVTEAEARYAEIEDICNGGMYADGTKAALNTAIEAAKAVVATGNAQTQMDVDLANTALQKAIYVAKAQRSIQYVTFDQLAAADWSDPLANAVQASVADDVLTLTNGTSNRSETVYAPGLGIRDILCFKYKLDSKSAWQGFALAQTNTNAFITSGTDGYFICINPGQVELQKYQGGKKQVQINVAITDEIFNGGAYYDVEVGAINNPDGSVGIHFKINDTVIFDPAVFVDTTEDKVITGTEQTIPGKPISNCGTFGIIVNPSNGNTYLKQGEPTVDLTALNETIAEAKALLAEMKEVSEGGAYYDGTKAELQTAIAAAEAIAAKGNEQIQADVDVANYNLENMLSTINMKREVQYVTFDRIDVSDWALPNTLNGTIAAADGELQMAYAASTAGRTQFMYVNELDTREMLCFQLKMDTLDAWNGFVLAQTNPDVFTTTVDGNSSYFLCFKANQIELQKRHNGKSYGNVVVTQNNREIMDAGEWMDIQVGAINNLDGSVRIYLKVNDTVVFDYLDTESPIYGCGNFGVVVQEASTSYMRIKPADLTAEPTIEQMGRTLNYENIISVVDIFDLKNVDLNEVDLDQDAGILVWSVEEYEALESIAYDEAHAKAGLKAYPDTTYYYGVSDGIITRDLHEEAYYAGYVKLADGTYIYSEAEKYSPATYAYNMLGKDETTEQTRTLCVTLLNYISAAQSYFYPETAEEDLVNATLTEDQKALDWSNPEFVLAPDIPADKTVAADELFERIGKTLLFEEQISLVSIYQIDTDTVTAAQEVGTIFWTAEQFETLTGTPSKDNFGEGTKISGVSEFTDADQWYACAPAVAAKDMADTQYYILGYLVDADGEVHYSGLMSYSFEQYIKNMASNTNTSAEMCAFAQRLYFYERAAQAALGN